MRHTLIYAALFGFLVFQIGCAKYVTPGGPADFRALGITAEEQDNLTEYSIATELSRKPAASFPARVAAVRVQNSGYRNHRYQGRDSGRFSVLTELDAESELDIERIASLPFLAGMTRLNRLVIPNAIESEEDLRKAAARVQADMLLLYTFDTRFGIDKAVPFLGEITLGLLPSEEAKVTSTASAALIDTRTGYIYALAEASDTQKQLANAWTSGDAVDQTRIRTERAAFNGLVDQLERAWIGLTDEYVPKEAIAVEGE